MIGLPALLFASALTQAGQDTVVVGVVTGISHSKPYDVQTWPAKDYRFGPPDPKDEDAFVVFHDAISSGYKLSDEISQSPKIYIITYRVDKSYGRYEDKPATVNDLHSIFKMCKVLNHAVFPKDQNRPNRAIIVSRYNCPERGNDPPVGLVTFVLDNHAVTGIYAMPDRPILVAVTK